MVKIFEVVLIIILNFALVIKESNQAKIHTVTDVTFAKEKQFPFLVALTNKDGEVGCSGSVVTHSKVLTAAHCSQLSNVIAGVIDLFSNNETSYEQKRNIIGFVIHPKYEEEGATTYSHDLAIVSTDTEFISTEYVSLIPIAPISAFLSTGSLVVSGGFGASDSGTEVEKDGKARYATFRLESKNKGPDEKSTPMYVFKPAFDTQMKFFGDLGGPVINAGGGSILYGVASSISSEMSVRNDVILTLPINHNWIMEYVKPDLMNKLQQNSTKIDYRRNGQGRIFDEISMNFTILSNLHDWFKYVIIS